MPVPSKEVELKNNFKFTKTIEFKNVSFSYLKNNFYVLKNINFKIKKGDRIGIIGETGSGKSTFIDLMIGILKPDEGKIFLDNNELHKQVQKTDLLNSVAHIPQVIYLIDSSYAQNIAFGIDPKLIDMNLVIECAKLAKIHDFIESQGDKYNTKVGEKGIKISGGQRQRIGIARALYKKSNILILDEATSALDEETERKVLEGLFNYGKELTIIVISHRKSSLSFCDRIINIKNNSIY